MKRFIGVVNGITVWPLSDELQIVAYQNVLNHHELISSTEFPAIVHQEASTHKKLIRLDGQWIVYQQHTFKQQQDQSFSNPITRESLRLL